MDALVAGDPTASLRATYRKFHALDEVGYSFENLGVLSYPHLKGQSYAEDYSVEAERQVIEAWLDGDRIGCRAVLDIDEWVPKIDDQDSIDIKVSYDVRADLYRPDGDVAQAERISVVTKTHAFAFGTDAHRWTYERGSCTDAGAGLEACEVIASESTRRTVERGFLFFREDGHFVGSGGEIGVQRPRGPVTELDIVYEPVDLGIGAAAWRFDGRSQETAIPSDGTPDGCLATCDGHNTQLYALVDGELVALFRGHSHGCTYEPKGCYPDSSERYSVQIVPVTNGPARVRETFEFPADPTYVEERVWDHDRFEYVRADGA